MGRPIFITRGDNCSYCLHTPHNLKMYTMEVCTLQSDNNGGDNGGYGLHTPLNLKRYTMEVCTLQSDNNGLVNKASNLDIINNSESCYLINNMSRLSTKLIILQNLLK